MTPLRARMMRSYNTYYVNLGPGRVSPHRGNKRRSTGLYVRNKGTLEAGCEEPAAKLGEVLELSGEAVGQARGGRPTGGRD